MMPYKQLAQSSISFAVSEQYEAIFSSLREIAEAIQADNPEIVHLRFVAIKAAAQRALDILDRPAETPRQQTESPMTRSETKQSSNTSTSTAVERADHYLTELIREVGEPSPEATMKAEELWSRIEEKRRSSRRSEGAVKKIQSNDLVVLHPSDSDLYPTLVRFLDVDLGWRAVMRYRVRPWQVSDSASESGVVSIAEVSARNVSRHTVYKPLGTTDAGEGFLCLDYACDIINAHIKQTQSIPEGSST